MKKAIQRLVRADDGTVRIVYIDAETLRELPSLEGYQVINQASNYWEPVKDVKDPNTPSDTVKSEHLNKQYDKSGDLSEKSYARQQVQKTIDDAKSVTPEDDRSVPTQSETSTRPSRPTEQQNGMGVTSQIGGGLGIGGGISSSVNAKTGNVTKQPGLDRPAYGDVSPVTKTEEIGDPRTATDISYAALSRPGVQRNKRPDESFMRDIGTAVHNFFGPDYSVDLQSGKGIMRDAKGRVSKHGNANHPTGFAGDFNVKNNKTGEYVSQSRMEDFGAYAAATGFKGIGIGPGYMNPGEMHLDKVHRNTTAWGDGNTGTTMTPGVEDAIENAGRTGAPVYGLGLPEYMPTTPTPRPIQDKATQISTVQMSEPKDTSFARKQIDNAVETPSNYEQSQSNPLGRFKDVTASAPGYTGIIGADAKEYGLYGDAAVRNNNPGNITANNWDSAIGVNSPNKNYSYSVYATPEEGAKTKASLLSGSVYSPMTVYDAMHRYAPPKDNPTQAYVNHIVKETGLPVTTKLKDMSETEFDRMLDAISSFESPRTPVDVKDSLGRHIGSYVDGQLTRDPHAEGYYTGRGSLMDTPSETSGIGRGSGHRDSFGYSGRTGSSDSPSERGGRFGGSGLGYSGYGGLDSPSERTGRDTGFGLGSKNTGSDKEKDRSLDKDKTDHKNGGRMTA